MQDHGESCRGRRFSHHFEWTANVVAEGKMILSKQIKLGKESNERLTGLTEISLQSENSASILPSSFPYKCHHAVFYPTPPAQNNFSKSCCRLTAVRSLSATRCLEHCLQQRYCLLPWPSSPPCDARGAPPQQETLCTCLLCKGVDDGPERKLFGMVVFLHFCIRLFNSCVINQY